MSWRTPTENENGGNSSSFNSFPLDGERSGKGAFEANDHPFLCPSPSRGRIGMFYHRPLNGGQVHGRNYFPRRSERARRFL